MKQILIGVQELLDTPNNKDPANGQACDMCLHRNDEYVAKTKAYAKKVANAS